MSRKLSKTELIKLVEKRMNGEGSEEEISQMLVILEANGLRPEVSDLIFWNKDNLTPEQIVEKALEYKPIIL